MLVSGRVESRFLWKCSFLDLCGFGFDVHLRNRSLHVFGLPSLLQPSYSMPALVVHTMFCSLGVCFMLFYSLPMHTHTNKQVPQMLRFVGQKMWVHFDNLLTCIDLYFNLWTFNLFFCLYNLLFFHVALMFLFVRLGLPFAFLQSVHPHKTCSKWLNLRDGYIYWIYPPPSNSDSHEGLYSLGSPILMSTVTGRKDNPIYNQWYRRSNHVLSCTLRNWTFSLIIYLDLQVRVANSS